MSRDDEHVGTAVSLVRELVSAEILPAVEAYVRSLPLTRQVAIAEAVAHFAEGLLGDDCEEQP